VQAVSADDDFEWGILTGAAPAGANPSVPPADAPRPSSVQVLSTLEEVRASVNVVAASAQRLMSIYTPDLEPDLYDQTLFLDIMKRFVLARSFAKVRVLLGDAQRLVRESNRFVAMGRRLTSYIDIRIVRENLPSPYPAYLVADDRAVVYRANARAWDGVADFDNPPVAKLHLLQFDEVWNSCAPEYGVRAAMR
jgi:hypothetical protein